MSVDLKTDSEDMANKDLKLLEAHFPAEVVNALVQICYASSPEGQATDIKDQQIANLRKYITDNVDKLTSRGLHEFTKCLRQACIKHGQFVE